MDDIGSEYGVPQFKCKIKQQKKEYDERKGREETDAEVCVVAATSMIQKVSTEGMEN